MPRRWRAAAELARLDTRRPRLVLWSHLRGPRRALRARTAVVFECKALFSSQTFLFLVL